MAAQETWLLDAQGLDRVLLTMAERLAEGRRTASPLRLVGVRTRGVPIATRLAERVARLLEIEVKIGAVDITLYRDDMDRRRTWPVLRGTDITFPVDGAEIVLVDDVLHTGRTVRAALNAICDLGRPTCVVLAAVVDRGGRELPFQADVVGLKVAADPDMRILVRTLGIDGVEGIVQVRPNGGP